MTRGPQRLDVTGAWFGRFFYPDAQPPVSFFANLQETAGRVTGTTSEPNTLGFGPPQLHAVLAGGRSGQAVMFTKLYDGEGHLAHSVRYDGLLSDDGTRLAGAWSFNNYAGTFEMMRPMLDEALEEVEHEADEPVTVGR